MQWRVVLESGETGFAQSGNSEHMKVLSLDSFTPALPHTTATQIRPFATSQRSCCLKSRKLLLAIPQAMNFAALTTLQESVMP